MTSYLSPANNIGAVAVALATWLQMPAAQASNALVQPEASFELVREPVTVRKAFDFPISTYPSTMVSTPGPNTPDANITLQVSQEGIKLKRYYGQYTAGFTEDFAFDFASGNVSYRGDHSGGGYIYALPAYGGDLAEYKGVVKSLQISVDLAQAPADVKEYLSSVEKLVSTKPLDSFTNNFHNATFYWNKDNSLTVNYTATEDREILTVIKGDSYKWTQTYRTPVQAGTGTVTIKFPLPDANGEFSICMNMNISPIGASEVNAKVRPDCHKVLN